MNQIIADSTGAEVNRISRRGVLPTLDRRRYTGSSEVNMPIRSSAFPLACFVLFAWMLAGAQAKPGTRNSDAQNSTTGAEYSGMYGFLNDGEFVQLTVEDQGHVIGFISRYADSSHEGGFLEHFLESGQLEGNRLVFTSKIVKGKSFQFQGTVERGEGKSRADEAYYVLKGTLVENTTDAAKKISSRSVDVLLRSFPQDLAPPPPTERK
jgi:hypothetical protein